jgi:hypothetical protein
MRMPIARSLLASLLACAWFGCYGSIGDEAPRAGAATAPVGQVRVGLQLGGGVELSAVSYVVSLDSTDVLSGTLMLAEHDAAFRGVFVLAEAIGYVLDLSATPASGPACFGTATFDVFAGVTTPVTVTLTCPSVTGSAGGAEISGVVNQCPTVSSLLASRASASVGETIAVEGVGSDPDDAPFPLAYMWSAGAGTALTPAAAATDVLCTEAGPLTVTFRIFDGDPECLGTTASIDLACIDAPPASDGGSGDDAGM